MTQRRDTVVVPRSDGTPVRVGWPELFARAEPLAKEMRRLGVRDGDTVCISGRSTYEAILVLNAAWLCGAAVSIAPATGSATRAGHDLMVRVRALDARAAYMEAAEWESLESTDDTTVQHLDEGTVRHCAGGGTVEGDSAPLWPVGGVSPDAVALYQATSGS